MIGPNDSTILDLGFAERITSIWQDFMVQHDYATVPRAVPRALSYDTDLNDARSHCSLTKTNETPSF